jgi:hypothetical protein
VGINGDGSHVFQADLIHEIAIDVVLFDRRFQFQESRKSNNDV